MTKENRVFFRLPLEVPVRFRSVEKSGWCGGTTANLSCGGMCLKTGRLTAGEVLVGTKVQVEMTLPGVPSSLLTLAVPMWIAPGSETRIGCKFVDLCDRGQETIHRVLQREGRGGFKASGLP